MADVARWSDPAEDPTSAMLAILRPVQPGVDQGLTLLLY